MRRIRLILMPVVRCVRGGAARPRHSQQNAAGACRTESEWRFEDRLSVMTQSGRRRVGRRPAPLPAPNRQVAAGCEPGSPLLRLSAVSVLMNQRRAIHHSVCTKLLRQRQYGGDPRGVRQSDN